MRTPMLAALAAILLALLSSSAAHGQAAAASRFTLPATPVDGIPIAEISGLAWDERRKLLYAVSDQGFVYHFRIQRDGPAIVAIEPVFAAALAGAADGPAGRLSRSRFNAEGLAVGDAGNDASGDGGLIVALEENPPRIVRFSPTGVLLGNLAVPPPADDISHYEKKGRGLEAIALHPAFGPMTAPESPLRMQPAGLHTIYANGRQWSFPRATVESRLKGLDVLPDGNLLVLERSRPGSKHVQVANLRRVDLSTCAAGGPCEATTIARLAPQAANFEGMTLLDAHHVLLASDNGGDPAQATTFILIELP